MQVNDTLRSRRMLFLFAGVCLLLQVCLAPYIGFDNGRINFAIVFSGIYALSRGGRPAVVAGFVAGLLYDLLTTGPIGLCAAICTVTSYFLGMEERNRFADGFVGPTSSFGIAALASLLVYHLCMLLVGFGTGFIELVFLRVLPSFAMTFICYIPFAYFQLAGASGSHSVGRRPSKRASHYSVKDL